MSSLKGPSVEVSKQIQKRRADKGLSQEELARAIYVSRQTLSNWETGKTYPDVQSLLLLSEVLDTTVDELVQGDIALMRKAALSDQKAMNIYAWIMAGAVVLGIVFAVGLSVAWTEPSGIGRMSKGDLAGAAVFVPLYAIALGAAIAVERIKRRNNIVTYREISEFMEGKSGSRIERDARDFSRSHPILANAAKVLAGAATALVLLAVVYAVMGLVIP